MRPLVIAGVFGTGITLLSTPAAISGVRRTFSYTEQGRAVATRPGTFDLAAGRSVVVQTHVLEPGFRAPWHRHPDRSLVLMKRGRLTVWFSCTEKEIWRAGNVYINPPSEMAVNEGDEPVELIVLYLNVPPDQPAGVLPVSPIMPPPGCPA
jgi:quercetin dioxygenase-like cupin family protein